MVECAESLLEQGGYVRPREVIAIVAGTRTKSGSTNFFRLHVMGEHSLESARFFTTHEEEQAAAPGTSKVKRVPTKADKAPVNSK